MPVFAIGVLRIGGAGGSTPRFPKLLVWVAYRQDEWDASHVPLAAVLLIISRRSFCSLAIWAQWPQILKHNGYLCLGLWPYGCMHVPVYAHAYMGQKV